MPCYWENGSWWFEGSYHHHLQWLPFKMKTPKSFKSHNPHTTTHHHIPQPEQSDQQISQTTLLYSPVPNKASQGVAILSVSNVTHNLIISPNGFKTPNWNLSTKSQHYQLKYKTRHYCDITSRRSQCTYCLTWK